MKNRDTKAVKIVCMAVMVIIVLNLIYLMVTDMTWFRVIPIWGLIAYVIGTICIEAGCFCIVQAMDGIEEDREENKHRG